MNLNKTTRKNVKWSFIESVSLKAVGFLLSIILARLLAPEDFGVLAIVNVFYLLTSLFIDGGLKEALIQKKSPTSQDYSTMFWLNLLIAAFLYILLFIAAPFIEDIYGYKDLGFLIRLQSVTLIIESFGLVQIVKATKNLDLKKITTARVPASIISFVIGITLAYTGFGILSLIIQQIANILIYTVLLVFNIRYKPKLEFSKESLKTLYNFGFKIIGISYLSRFYLQSLNLLFGYFFTPFVLGLYSKSRNLQGAPIEIMNSTFAKGLYPTMVRVQDHNRLLKKIFIENSNRLTYLMVILNGILFFNAYDIILILLGKNWIEMTVYLQIAAVGSIFFPLSAQVLNIFKAKGKPSLILKIESISKGLSLIIILALSLNFDLVFILWTLAVFKLTSGVTYLYYCSKLLNFNFLKEIYQLSGMILYHAILGFFIRYLIDIFIENSILKIITFIIFYISIAYGFGMINKRYNIKSLI